MYYSLSDQAVCYTDEIQNALRKICLTWAKTLAKFNRQNEAIALLEKTDRILVSDEETVALQYHLYMKKKIRLKPRHCLTIISRNCCASVTVKMKPRR